MIAIIDLDPMIYNVAYHQYAKAGNRDNPQQVKDHVKRFINTIKKNSKADEWVGFYQKAGHINFRIDLLPRYKEHRTVEEFARVWKPTILETFKELNFVGLGYIESDDAVNIVARDLKYEVIVISADKDLKQIPCIHYNPYKANIPEEERWITISPEEGERRFYKQVLMGDGNDMSLDLCGIKGVGEITADKLLDGTKEYGKVIAAAYTKAYGKEEGFKRAKLTYQMVRLLDGSEKDSYTTPQGRFESELILTTYSWNLQKIKSQADELFPNNPNVADLFK